MMRDVYVLSWFIVFQAFLGGFNLAMLIFKSDVSVLGVAINMAMIVIFTGGALHKLRHIRNSAGQ